MISYQFRKHYTLDEARALLPQVREWLKQLQATLECLRQTEERVGQMLANGADAVGGSTVNTQINLWAEFRKLRLEFEKREIQIKDVERGLIDFPSLMAGKEVFLCWESDEDDIEFWHDLDSGYAGRERL